MDNTEELPTVIAFCAGYGGIERGLELAGVEHRVLAYVEIEAFAIANLVAKMEAGKLDPAPIYTDLKTFPAHLFRGAVDLITGGYPCQPFSSAGKRLGKDDPRHLWPYIKEHIQAIEPVRCFFENVDGHISLGLREVLSGLEELGYKQTWGIFSAREVGAGHQRKRVYIMANTDSSFRERGRLPGGVQPEFSLPDLPSHDGRWATPQQWLPEPRVGRVVDGCADRVDRLRMLGNGVVPQTAAKAWLTLTEETNDDVPVPIR